MFETYSTSIHDHPCFFCTKVHLCSRPDKLINLKRSKRAVSFNCDRCKLQYKSILVKRIEAYIYPVSFSDLFRAISPNYMLHLGGK
jgi:hypothetical protein